MALSRDQILNANDHKRSEAVEVPEWGGEVLVGVMSGAVRERFEALEKKAPDICRRAWVAAYTVVDEEGNRLFTEADIPVLAERSATALDRIWPVAFRINGLGEAEVKDAEKNS